VKRAAAIREFEDSRKVVATEEPKAGASANLSEKCNPAPAFGRPRTLHLLFRVARSRLGRLRRFAVFDPAFVAQITTLLRFTLAFG
jgi:hypothetical protein